jgi:uncharacterized protein (UPF0210 family)
MEKKETKKSIELTRKVEQDRVHAKNVQLREMQEKREKVETIEQRRKQREEKDHQREKRAQRQAEDESRKQVRVVGTRTSVQPTEASSSSIARPSASRHLSRSASQMLSKMSRSVSKSFNKKDRGDNASNKPATVKEEQRQLPAPKSTLDRAQSLLKKMDKEKKERGNY